MARPPEPSIGEIVDQLERTGQWGHVGRLSDQRCAEVQALARKRGFDVRCAGWTDRPEEWFEVVRPPGDSYRP